MMTRLIFTLSNGRIPGGVEVFNGLLQKAIPSTRILSAEDLASKTNIPLIQEPLLGKRLAALAEKEFPNAEAVLANGMHGWSVDSKKYPLITIMHGTYRGLAQAAYPATSPIRWRMEHFLGFFEKRSAKNAHVCIANSHATQREVKKFYGVEARVVELPIDTQRFRPGNKKQARKELGWDPTEKIILFAGNPIESKGWDIFCALTVEFPHVQFKALCFPRVEATEKNIEVLASVPQEKFPVFLHAADALVFPSRYEGFGFLPLEAVASSCPVIATKHGILESFACEGIIIADSTVKSFAECLRKLLNDPPAMKNTHALIAKRFSMEKFAEGYREAIADAVRIQQQEKVE